MLVLLTTSTVATVATPRNDRLGGLIGARLPHGLPCSQISPSRTHLPPNICDVSTASIRTAFATPTSGNAPLEQKQALQRGPQKVTSPAGFGVQHEMRNARRENRKQQRSMSIQASARGPTRPIPRDDCPRKLFRFQIVSRRSDVVAQILSRLSGNNVTAHRACFASATVPSSKGQPSTWCKPQRQSASEMRHRQSLTARQGLTGGGLWC